MLLAVGQVVGPDVQDDDVGPIAGDRTLSRQGVDLADPPASMALVVGVGDAAVPGVEGADEVE
ncbi:hypothetical protein [Nonomuraea fuscirosea]|uniref:hypothetical protein n=1 Tax=Nonomuraea fuscirosea TaxID=1291556 RepID=UPI0034314461